jgi:hypothetical protein
MKYNLIMTVAPVLRARQIRYTAISRQRPKSCYTSLFKSMPANGLHIQ